MFFFGYYGLNEIERERFIYRILPLRRLKDILVNKEIGFVNPKLWEKEDPYENFLMNQNIQIQDGTFISLREATKNLFGSCWTFNSNADFSWKVYTKSANRNDVFVQIKCRISKILEEFSYLKEDEKLNSLQIGKIKYLKWKDLKNKYERKRKINLFELMTNFSNFEKRFEYRHEKEIRILINYLDHSGYVLTLKFDLNNVTKTLMLDPRLDYKNFLNQKKEIQSWGFNGRVYRSTLYTPPKMNLYFENVVNDNK